MPLIYLVPALHFVWDFVLQSHKMATNKSSRFEWLTYHCAVYATWTAFTGDWRVVLAVFFTHLGIDFVTSKITSRLWQQQSYHYFFVTIGADQLLHMITIFWILQLAGFHMGV